MRIFTKAILLSLAVALGATQAAAFGGENLLSTKWRDWHHNTLCRFAAEANGFVRKKVGESESEDPDSPAAEVAWHADFIDGYAYNPLYWVLGGPSRIACSAGIHDELVKLHFDDLTSTAQVRYHYFQYTTGTIQGLLWAKQLYESGRTLEGVAVGRQVLGVSLHAMQDFYSHSNWVDVPGRREATWFSKFTGSLSELVNSPIYTGTYEKPAHLGVKPHGVMSPIISALMQIAPIMDALSSEFSPVREMPIMDMWRKSRSNVATITPGIFPDNSVSTLTDGLLAPPASTFIGLPPGMLFVAPPGIALDATYVRNIAVQQRGLTDINGDQAFKFAYQRAYDASVQWLGRIDATMNGLAGGPAFMAALKTFPVTNKQAETFENFALQAYEFVSAGPYPIASTTAQSQLATPASIPAKQYYLRVRLKTATDTFSGTDADIKLIAGGREFLLDVSPTHDQDTLHAVFSFNDFENGMDTNYLVGPFNTMPSTIELKNVSADAGQVLGAFFSDFGQAIVGFFQSIANIFSNLLGSKPDFVGQNRIVWQPGDLSAMSANWQFFNLVVDGGAEGKYTVAGQIRKTGSTDTEDIYQVQLPTMRCNKESTIDQLKIGLGGDEPFLIAALAPLPGDIRKNRTGVFKWAHDNHLGKLQTPTGSQTMELQANRTGSFYFDWTNVRIPKNHGMMSLAVCVMESDDDTNADRDELMNQFAGELDSKTKTIRENFRSALGRAVAADWKLGTIEVYAFSKGGAVEAGTVLNQQANRWIPGGGRAVFNLDPNGLKSFPVDVLSLQKTLFNKIPIKIAGPIQNTIPNLRPPAGTTIKPPPGARTGVAEIKNPAPAGGGEPAKVVVPGGPATVPFPNAVGTKVGPRPGLTVPGRGQEAIKALLVDDDRSENNNARVARGAGFSKCDDVYRNLLAKAGIAFDTHVVDPNGNGPDPVKLAGYNFVVWYTADNNGNRLDSGDLSVADMASIQTYLGGGNGRTLILVSPGIINNLQGSVPSAKSNEMKWVVTDSPFMKATLGLQGGQGFIARFVEGTVQSADGKTYAVAKDNPVKTNFSVVNPTSAVALFSYACNPDGKGVRLVPTGVWNRIGGSRIVYLGFPVENTGADGEAIFGTLVRLHRGPP